MKNTASKKMDPKNDGKKNSRPLLKLIRRQFSKKAKDETDRFSGVVMVPLGSPVSLGRQISDMTWEKARALAAREKHLWW